MAIHVRTWSGCRTFRITDMTNACKRGKKCRTLHFSGVPWAWRNDAGAIEDNAQQTGIMLYRIAEGLQPTDDYDAVAERVKAIVADALAQGVPVNWLTVREEEIRGVDAPRVPLTAGVEGKWSIGADERGISGRQYDDINEWSLITNGQENSRAYDIAKRVWPLVSQTRTLYEAEKVLTNAGARLHGYCAVD